VGLDEALRDREPEPGADVVFGRTGAIREELIEQVGDRLRRDARSGVLDGDDRFPLLIMNRNPNDGACGRELVGVAEQIQQDALQPPEIAGDDRSRRR
jgi:hypothetical protein